MSEQKIPATANRPVAITLGDAITTILTTLFDPNAGAFVCVELQNPANSDAIYTVPSGKTFTGRILVAAHGTGGALGVSAATGGSLVKNTPVSGPNPVSVSDIVIAGGAGNAVTATVTGNVAGSVALVGHVK